MGLGHAEFIAMFDEWAPSYDDTVFRETPVDGFEGYEQILERVALLAGGGTRHRVLDVGAGTGNLSMVLRRTGADVTAVEPSAVMRQVAQEKMPELTIADGHFLALPFPDQSFDTITSTYAFHHLTDDAKRAGMAEMLRVVRPGGRIIIGDVAWKDKAARRSMIDRAVAGGKPELAKEIEEEYYPTIGVIKRICDQLGVSVSMQQMSQWVWLFRITKPGQ